jgi:catechol 2,3-dioxygenase-like lactoylglutathione lyase family enzyme
MAECDHIGILTNNASKLADFYIHKLGFKKEKQEILPASLAKPIFGISSDCQFIRLASAKIDSARSSLRSKGIKIEIFQPRSLCFSDKLMVRGYNHWGFCVNDKKKFCQELKRKKVRIIEAKRNGHSVYFIKDPDGNRIEIRD